MLLSEKELVFSIIIYPLGLCSETHSLDLFLGCDQVHLSSWQFCCTWVLWTVEGRDDHWCLPAVDALILDICCGVRARSRGGSNATSLSWPLHHHLWRWPSWPYQRDRETLLLWCIRRHGPLLVVFLGYGSCLHRTMCHCHLEPFVLLALHSLKTQMPQFQFTIDHQIEYCHKQQEVEEKNPNLTIVKPHPIGTLIWSVTHHHWDLITAVFLAVAVLWSTFTLRGAVPVIFRYLICCQSRTGKMDKPTIGTALQIGALYHRFASIWIIWINSLRSDTLLVYCIKC